MRGLSEKSINWNHPHYPVVSDGLVFIKILGKAINVHTIQDKLRQHENYTVGLGVLFTHN